MILALLYEQSNFGLSLDTTVQSNPLEPTNLGVKALSMDESEACRALLRDKACIPTQLPNGSRVDNHLIGLEASEKSPSIKDDSGLGLPEENLPDFIVQKHAEPLFWVKIPNGFAGVWETRKKLKQTIYFDKSGKPSYRERPLSIREVARMDWEHLKRYDFFENPRYGSVDIESNQYRFIRGMQKDEEGNIWDCPSLRNVEFQKVTDDPKVSTNPSYMRTVIVHHGSEEIVSDQEMLEQLTTKDGEPRSVDRHLLSDTFVDARSFPSDTAVHPEFLEIEYLPEFKVAEFKPIDIWRGVDLKASFQSFRKKSH